MYLKFLSKNKQNGKLDICKNHKKSNFELNIRKISKILLSKYHNKSIFGQK